MIGLLAVQYSTDQLHLSANYFGDLIKKETGKSAQEYIQFAVIGRAKNDWLKGRNPSVRLPVSSDSNIRII